MVGAGNLLLNIPVARKTKQHTQQQKITIWGKRECARKQKQKEKETHIFCCHTRNIFNYKKNCETHKKSARAGEKPKEQKLLFLSPCPPPFSPNFMKQKKKTKKNLNQSARQWERSSSPTLSPPLFISIIDLRF